MVKYHANLMLLVLRTADIVAAACAWGLAYLLRVAAGRIAARKASAERSVGLARHTVVPTKPAIVFREERMAVAQRVTTPAGDLTCEQTYYLADPPTTTINMPHQSAGCLPDISVV
jgi:hypothetical protein